ncbi:unnamed protein product [Urochloa decumbens]|uniref:RING-type domain-containing protein n=1 Tax=Urochloa decumbens TaxID=240449 RepID=A0ABC9GRS1_9POAL
MEGDDPMTRVLLGLSYVSIALMFGSLIFLGISELVACVRRWRSRREAKLAADRLLESVADVSYHQLPDAAEDAASSSCVICVEDYGESERRFVLPGCAHTFHRGCIAPWLRQGNTTCPLCRSRPTAAGIPLPPAQPHRISTAEDMV